MNQFLSNKIIVGIVALALLVGVGVLVSSGDTSSTTRNAALVVATPCTKPGQVTKVSKQSVVCATTNTGSLWYATMKAKGKAQPCTTPGEIRKKSDIVWVCGVIKKKKLWQATRPLPPAVVASTTVIEPGATQPTPALDSTQVATPDAPIVADNTVLADTKIPDDKIVTKAIEDVTPPTVAPTTPAATTPTTTPTTVKSTTVAPLPVLPTVTPTSTPAATTPANTPANTTTPKTYQVRDIGPGGGIVFYVAPTSFTCGVDLKATCTYLEAAITTTSTWTPDTTAQWGCYGTSVPGTSFEIGTGRANTKIIIEAKNSNGQICSTSTTAASIAKAYNGGGKDDWFLPSRKELDALCFAFFTGRSGTKNSVDKCQGSGNTNSVTSATNATPVWSFAADVYWSSSEGNANLAWNQSFINGSQGSGNKNFTLYVRPVRAF